MVRVIEFTRLHIKLEDGDIIRVLVGGDEEDTLGIGELKVTRTFAVSVGDVGTRQQSSTGVHRKHSDGVMAAVRH